MCNQYYHWYFILYFKSTFNYLKGRLIILEKNKIKYIGTFINLCALGCLCYAIYQYGVALEAMSKNFNIIDFITGLAR